MSLSSSGGGLFGRAFLTRWVWDAFSLGIGGGGNFALSTGPEHQATSAVPQPTDNTHSASHHLAELREEKLKKHTRS